MTTHPAPPLTTDDTATAAPGPPLDPVGGAPAKGDGAGWIGQAETVDIGVDEGQDPFDATLLMAGTDNAGRDVALWTRLTPTTITDITDQLTQLLRAQQQLLSVRDDQEPTDDGDPYPDVEPELGSGRLKGFFDPMGIRHLKDRSPRTTVILGAAIAALVLLAFVLQWIRG